MNSYFHFLRSGFIHPATILFDYFIGLFPLAILVNYSLSCFRSFRKVCYQDD